MCSGLVTLISLKLGVEMRNFPTLRDPRIVDFDSHQCHESR